MAIEPGMKVAFSAQFLRDTGQETGEAGLLRGEVESLDPELEFLANVLWTNCFPQRRQKVNVGNLVEQKDIGAEAAKARPGFMKVDRRLG